MVIVVCVEDRNGMLFNQRRVSRDFAVYRDLLEQCPTCLWMNGYSASLFAELPQEKLRVSETFLQQAATGEWCFVENVSLPDVTEAMEQIIVYRWNRKYPADVYFEMDLTDWQLLSTAEFAGNSHEKITKEIYGRR